MSSETNTAAPPGIVARALRTLRPSHEHTAYSATILVVGATMLSRVIGYVREAYIAWAFGAGARTDALVAAFTLPDIVNYMLAGATASITFVSMLTRYKTEGREAQAQRAFSVIITIMTVLLSAALVLAGIFTPQFTRWWFPKFNADQIELCIGLTRILLPAQLFFVIGGLSSAVLLSRRMFLIPALAPVFYNVFIILGGVLFGHRYGVAGLAIGALAGSFVGPFLINAIGASRAGMAYRPILDFRDSGFREWLRLSIPLMLGVSLVTADQWIINSFASGGIGDITRLNYAKRLFAVPMAVLGQATGQVSLPFFARLFSERKMREFSDTVNAAVFRISASSFLLSAWMMACALPVVDLVYRRGKFNFAVDAHETATFFFWFAISLVFWTAQALYARAFYAAGNTLTPMISGTLVTLASVPVYWLLARTWSATGLAIASDIGIAAHTLVLAFLLRKHGLVRLGDLPWTELMKALAIAVCAGVAAGVASRFIALDGRRMADFASVAVVTVVWAAVVLVGLRLTNSRLVSALQRRNTAEENTVASG